METTIGGNGSIKNEGNVSTSSDPNDYFYFSDGTNIHRVDSTNASITRLMYDLKWPAKLNESWWILGAGFESVTLTLTTQYDGKRTIKMNSPIIDGGFQINWRHAYFNIKFGFAFTKTVTNFSYNEGFSVGIGYVW